MVLSLNQRLVVVIVADANADDQPLLPGLRTNSLSNALTMCRRPPVDLMALAIIDFEARVRTVRWADCNGTRSRTPKWRGIMASYEETTSVPQSVTIRRLVDGGNRP